MLNRALQVSATGVSITTSGVSANAAVPNDSSGTKPRYVRIAATVAAYVRIGSGAQTAVTTDMLVQPGDAVIVNVPAASPNVAAIQVAAAGVVNVTPIENL